MSQHPAVAAAIAQEQINQQPDDNDLDFGDVSDPYDEEEK